MPDNMSKPTKPLFAVIFLVSGAVGCDVRTVFLLLAVASVLFLPFSVSLDN